MASAHGVVYTITSHIYTSPEASHLLPDTPPHMVRRLAYSTTMEISVMTMPFSWTGPFVAFSLAQVPC
jgi:hypothetical protein